MIEHIVAFNLKAAAGSAEEKDFLDALYSFSEIPGVQDLKVVRQISSKGSFAFAVSMWFDDQQALDAYDASQAHVDFVNDRWLPECVDWATLDFVAL